MDRKNDMSSLGNDEHFINEKQTDEMIDSNIQTAKESVDLLCNNSKQIAHQGDQSDDSKSTIIENRRRVKPNENYEDMLYFVCNLCPFLCTTAGKITEHLENKHKTNAAFKPLILKCPACANTFFHKLSLRSHLIYDHQVGNEVKLILQAVIYYAKKNSVDGNKKKKCISLKEGDGMRNNNIGMEADNPKEKLVISSSEISLHKGKINLSRASENERNSNLFCKLPSVIEKVTESKVDDSLTEGITLNAAIECLPKTSKIEQKSVDMQKCTVPMCKVFLHDSTKMFYHIKCHVDGGFKCLECNELFSWWKPLTGHLWRNHKIDMELYACEKCDYKTFSLGKLNNIHRLIHNEARPFKCDMCNKSFKNSKQLRNHKVKHKDFLNKTVTLCAECNKVFSDRRQLRIHMDSVHKKLKPFLCSYCGYKGASRSSLKMHMRQHTGEKPFSCDQCNYRTADHNSLRRHKLRHTGQKPYKCAYCDYACIQSSTYKVHLKTKHPGQERDLLFSCHECQFRTINKEMYFTHVTTVHKNAIFLCL